jgi:hypothetical protein
MTRVRRLEPRVVALAAAAALAVVLGHLLDAFGLLPGVHEDAAVRAAALAPAYDVLTIVGAAALAFGVDALLRQRLVVVACAALVAGQVGLLGLPELLGREEAGQGEQWGALAVAVGLQVLLSVATIAVVVAVDAVLVRSSFRGTEAVPAAERRPCVCAASPRRGRRPDPLRTRGPPVLLLP